MENISGNINGISQRDFAHMESIRDEIISSNIYSHRPEDLFSFFLDSIQLFFQPSPDTDPIVILFWEGDRCIYSSFQDLYFCSAYHLSPSELFPPPKGVLISKSLNIWMTIHRIRSKVLETFEDQSLKYIHPKNSQENRVLEPDVNLMEQIDCLLFHDSNHKKQSLMNQYKIIPEFSDNLIKTIKNNRPNFSSKVTDQKIEDLDYKNVMLPCLDLFRDALDEVYEEIKHSRDFKFQNQKLPLGNLFCVVKTIQSGELRFKHYPYTAGLLLSNNQKEKFKVWFENSHTKKNCTQVKNDFAKCLDQLEAPLGLNSRAAVDIVFSSGVIDFGRNINDGLWNKIETKNEQERQCNLVNNCIFPSTEASLEYLPIYFNGFTWLAFLTFSPLDKAHRDSRWENNYYFYRDLVSSIIIPLRIKSKTIYISQAIEMAFRESVNWGNHPTEISKEINRLWDILARVYPYPRFCIFDRKEYDSKPHQNRGNKSIIKIPGSNQEWVFVIEENPYFSPPQGNWGRVKNDFFEKELIRSMQLRIIERHQINLEREAHNKQTRDLENRINVTGRVKYREYYDKLWGSSPPMLQLYQQIERIAPYPATVIIEGESGTGKELVAKAIHADYKKGNFVSINCSSLDSHLFGSELFGHIQGAFTDAKASRDGAIKTANGGILFLDEIGDMPLTVQPMFLRYLQEKELKPVGSDVVQKVDVRVIVATSCNLEEEVSKGKFRGDLYERLNFVQLMIPPLRDRKKDIPILVKHFIEKQSQKLNKFDVEGITELAMFKLKEYDWPWNVRELENCIGRAIILCNGKFIEPSDIILSDRSKSKNNERFLGANKKNINPHKEIRIKERIDHVFQISNGGKKKITAREIDDEMGKRPGAFKQYISDSKEDVIEYLTANQDIYYPIFKTLVDICPRNLKKLKHL